MKLSSSLPEEYFEEFAELPIPPYIQKARAERHSRFADAHWYQTTWASCPGSLAAPTASLHFSDGDIQELKNRGVHVLDLTLHVGLGTFLPVLKENLKEHSMHSEFVRIPTPTWRKVLSATQEGHAVWALGTTVARALESAAHGLVGKNKEGDWEGLTQLFIQPGFQWKVVERLLTNFHQPESTLLALVASFSNLDKVKNCYTWAVQRKFRLFSYGNLTAWVGHPQSVISHQISKPPSLTLGMGDYIDNISKAWHSWRVDN